VKSATFSQFRHPKNDSKNTISDKEFQKNMEMIIDFPGGSRVDAHFGNFTVATDQPPVASAPTPFAVFLSSIGTCAGIYVLGFCQQRGIPTEGVRIVQHVYSNPMTHMVDKIDLEIQVPPAFPDKYRDSLIRSAELCAVKKHLENPPKFGITTTKVEVA
jgi:putative redox protein